MKFCIDRPSGFKKMFENNGQMYMYIAPGQSTPRGQIFSSTVFSVNIVLCCKLSPIK